MSGGDRESAGTDFARIGELPVARAVTRRHFLCSLPVAGGVLMALPAVGTCAITALTAACVPGASVSGPVTQSASGAVLSFHLDQPWLDVTGQSAAYHPPSGACGGEPLAQFDDATLSRFYGLI